VGSLSRSSSRSNTVSTSQSIFNAANSSSALFPGDDHQPVLMWTQCAHTVFTLCSHCAHTVLTRVSLRHTQQVGQGPSFLCTIRVCNIATTPLKTCVAFVCDGGWRGSLVICLFWGKVATRITSSHGRAALEAACVRSQTGGFDHL
jgi:hypothetical protein